MGALRIAGPNFCPVNSGLNAHLAEVAAEDAETAHVESCEQDAIDDLMRDDDTICDWLDAITRDASTDLRITGLTHRLLAELFDGGLPAPHPGQSERQDARYDRLDALIGTLRDAYEQWLRDSGVLRTTAEAMAERQRREAEEAEAEDAYFERMWQEARG